jgi:hypothetical protein
MRCGWVEAGSDRWKISFINTDVKTCLLKLLFYIHFALLHERQQIAAQPCDFGEGEPVLRDVNGLSGEMRRRCVAFGRSSVAINVHQMLLKFNGTDSGVYL